jgi:hypothetical protein
VANGCQADIKCREQRFNAHDRPVEQFEVVACGGIADPAERLQFQGQQPMKRFNLSAVCTLLWLQRACAPCFGIDK